MHLKEFELEIINARILGWYTTPNNAKGVLVLVHGFGEHSGRYFDSVVPELLKVGLSVILYDNIGHGKSSGKRGHCSSYENLLNILNHVIQKAKKLYPCLPLILYGHSMGGNLVLNYSLRRDTSIFAMIATSPYLRLAFKPPKWKMIAGKALLRLWPSITMPSGLDPQGISRIPEEIEKYKNDPLIHDKVSPMFSFPVIRAGEWAISNSSKLKVNTLLLHGTGDPIIDFRGTQEFHQNSKKTELELIEGGYHELHHDLCKSQMLAKIGNWLGQQL